MTYMALLLGCLSQPDEVDDSSSLPVVLDCGDPPEFLEMVHHLIDARCSRLERCAENPPEGFYYDCMIGFNTLSTELNTSDSYCIDYCSAVDVYDEWQSASCSGGAPTPLDSAFFQCEEEEW